ncbi:MAG: S4 domain-containing protein YaaA [Candidatus Izemoplasmatales bacterium]|jgi:S4 domain protein YaaA|nr:S4 domain-containing protein YaaA [Acholeplasmataceae bacterium]
MKTIQINTPFITLGQLLKFAGIINNGGEAKGFLRANRITINDEVDNRRGKKIHPGDKVTINDKIELLISK